MTEHRSCFPSRRTEGIRPERPFPRPTSTRSAWVQPWRWRWLGRRKWHRLAIGPRTVSIYIYHRAERTRPFVSWGWMYRGADGDMRHVPTFARWVRAVAKRERPFPRPTGWGTIALVYGCLLLALVAAVVWGTEVRP